MKKHSFLCAVMAIALLFVLFSCEGEISQTFYKVKLDFANGDAVVEADVPAGHTFTIPQSVPVRDGYEFDCWLCNGTKYKPGDSITVNSDLTVTAVWKEKAAPKDDEVVVTFVLNGTKVAEQIVKKGGKATVPTEGFTVPEDYTLDGWYLNGSRYDFDTVVNENLTLTATWYKNTLTVTFVYGEGTENKTEKVERNSVVTKPVTPEKEGKTFGGWYSGETVYDFDTPVTEDITLTASWIEKGKVNVTISYGNGTADSTEEKAVNSEYTLPQAPEREGYTFRFWSIDGVEYAAGDKITLTESTVIKALWKDNASVTSEEVIVGFVINGSRIEQKVKKGETVTAPATGFKVPDGYDIEGWYKGESKYEFSTAVNEDISLTAKLERNRFNVIFMVGEEKVSEVTVSRGKAVSEPTDIKVSDGYGIEGWYKEGVTEKYVFSTPVTDDITLTAKLERNRFTVTFKLDGTKVGEAQVNKGKAVSATPDVKIEEGHVLDGWYQGDATEKYVFSTPVTDDITLNAKSVLKTFTVRFVSEDKEYKTKTVNWGTAVEAPDNPTPEDENLKFDGWYYGDTKYVFTDLVKSDITLTAKWIKKGKVTVTIKYENGSADATVTCNEGSEYSLPAAPGYEGHTFKGWSIDGSSETKNAGTKVTLSSSIVITAKWEIQRFKVTFNTDGGTSIAERTVDWGTVLSEDVSTTREGYNLEGWKKGNDTFDLLSTPIKEDTALTAVWKIKTYTVTFKDGTETLDTVTVDWNTAVSAINTPTKKGHTFDKWLNGSKEYNFSDVVKSDLTLTASWIVDKYDITFESGVEGTTIASQTVEYGKTVSEPTETLTKEGYHLEGWLNGSEKYDFTKPVEGKMTLTANWVKDKYRVTFKVDDTTYHYADVEYGETVKAPETNPEKEGYNFSGWGKTDGTAYDFDSNVTGNLILKAQWKEKTFTVTFRSEGKDVDTKTVSWGQTYIPKPSNPASSVTSKKFAFWTVDGTNPYDFDNTRVTKDLVLEASFVSSDEVVVTFVYNDDGATENLVETYKKGELTLKSAESNGRTFEYWQCSADGVNYKSGETYTLTDSVTFTAYWTVVGVTVHFYPENGDDEIRVVVARGKTVTEPTEPERLNSKFMYWYYWENGKKQFDFSSPITTSDDYFYLYAKYDPEYYTVTFNPANGDTTWERDVTWGSTVYNDRTDPKYEGYKFAGWYSDDSTEFDFNTRVMQDYTLTAHWVKEGETLPGKCVITYKYNDSTLVNDTVTVDYGSREYLNGKLNQYGKSPVGKSFVKWVMEDGTDLGVGYYEITSDMVLTAVWETAKVRVTINYGDGTGKQDSVEVPWGGTVPSDLKLENPTRVGYDFVGWYTNDPVTYNDVEFDFSAPLKPKNNSISIFAKWKEKSFTANFYDAAENGKVVITQPITYGGVVSRPDDPVLAGYRFDGWYLKDDANPYDFSTSVKGDVNLYAKWSETSKYTVYLRYLNGNETQMEVALNDAGTAEIKSEPKPSADDTLTGLSFIGWYKSQSDPNPYDFVAEEKVEFPLTIYGDTYLYAKYVLADKESVAGIWTAGDGEGSSGKSMKFEKGDSENVVYNYDSENETSARIGTWTYDETNGQFKMKCEGFYGLGMAGIYSGLCVENLGDSSERMGMNEYYMEYETERTKRSSTDVTGTWIQDISTSQWLYSIEFADVIENGTVTKTFHAVNSLYANTQHDGTVISSIETSGIYKMGKLSKGSGNVLFFDDSYVPFGDVDNTFTAYIFCYSKDMVCITGFRGESLAVLERSK